MNKKVSFVINGLTIIGLVLTNVLKDFFWEVGNLILCQNICHKNVK